jgi:hypothetical protein
VIRNTERAEVATRTITGKDIIVDLAQLRSHLSPDLKVIADALAYCIVGIDHLLLHAHDDDPVEH